MRYLRSYGFLFDSPRWPANLLAGAACQFVPVLGPMAFTGYAFELVESVPRNGDRDHPVFDLGHLESYLLRGLWPLIVQMAGLIPVMLVSLVLLAAMADTSAVTTRARVTLGLLPPVVFGVLLVLSVFLAPLTLYVGLRQELAGVQAFVQDYFRRVGRETLLTQVFVAVTGTSVALVGGSLFCVGVYPALALVHLAQYHLLAQLYGLYLQRGGKRLATS